MRVPFFLGPTSNRCYKSNLHSLITSERESSNTFGQAVLASTAHTLSAMQICFFE